MMTYQQVEQLNAELKSKGLKMTPARQIMLSIFMTGENKLFDALQVYNLVKSSNSKINFSTVYRNLEILVRHNIIEKINLDGKAVYTLFAKQHHRHHMICTSCRKSVPLPFCPLKKLENTLKKELNGFLPLEHRVEIYGYCKECRLSKK